MSKNTVRERPVPTMSKPDGTITDSLAQGPCAKGTPIPCDSTQDTVLSIKEVKEPRPAGIDGPSRPTTPKPASTWPKASNDDTEKEVQQTQLAKDKVLITAQKMSLAQSQHGTKPWEAKEVSPTTIAPGHEENQKAYQREIKAMTRSLKVREIQRMLSPNPNNEVKFTEYWEQKLLPQIVDILEANIQGTYSINVRRGYGPDQRVIDLMTQGNCAKKYSDVLEAAKNELLPEEFSSTTQFDFRSGKHVYCVDDADSQISSQVDYSAHCLVGNPHHYNVPVMGDSAGSRSNDGSATLGPLLQIGEKFYRLVNWHMFDDGREGRFRRWNMKSPPEELDLVHPSPSDLQIYSPDKQHVEMGNLVAFSGHMYKTYRPATSSDAVTNPLSRSSQVTTDWALFETKGPGLLNRIRHIMDGQRSDPAEPAITGTASEVKIGDVVCSTGRSSGHSFGTVCRRGLLKNEDGTFLRDWAVSSDYDDSWHDGMGAKGDSGAGIVNCVTNKLIGQLWGRNHYDEDPKEPAITYFTTMSEIYNDIQVRWPDGQCPRPRLPGEVPSTEEARGTSVTNIGGIDEMLAAEDHTPPSGEGYSNLESKSRRSSVRSSILVASCGNIMAARWVQHAATWPRLQT
ncbi:hypothetical protein PG997_013021 [Apiospora hydei]|uniref:Peptidase S1 domain-containing protein n=1 Tax=Apiospora hydei TaxID=1337664 RepID=A0ABR1V881_9PEZI